MRELDSKINHQKYILTYSQLPFMLLMRVFLLRYTLNFRILHMQYKVIILQPVLMLLSNDYFHPLNLEMTESKKSLTSRELMAEEFLAPPLQPRAS